MEQQDHKNHFESLPTELTCEILLLALLNSKKSQEAFLTLARCQSVHKQWLSLINDDTFTANLIQQLYAKFIILDSEELNLHRLLCCTKTGKNNYQQALLCLKMVTCYALLHHNELTQEAEKESYPLQNLEMGAYCTALRKSYRKIVEKIAQGQNFSALTQAITDDYKKLEESQQPLVTKKLYKPEWDAYRITAELLYLFKNTDSVVQAALKSTKLSERLVQYVSLSSFFEKMFDNPYVFQPTFLSICDIFLSSNCSIKEEYIEKSAKLYIFE